MSRPHIPRRAQPRGLPPSGLLPRFSASQVRDLSLVNHVNLDALATGTADEATLWHCVGGALTWHRVAQRLGVGIPEMAAQLDMLTSVVQRYGRTGRIGFTGTEYQQAKVSVQVMDELAARVDRPTAIEAANWSEARVNQMAAATVRTSAPQEQAA